MADSAAADAVVTTRDDGLVDLSSVPWRGFALAAQAAVQHLVDQVGLDLWMVTRVEGERQVVVAAAGSWRTEAAPGTVLPWSQSYCLRMVQGEGPQVADDVLVVPAYAAVTTGPYSLVRCYAGVPLLDEDGRLYGTLCGVAGRVGSTSLNAQLPLLQLVARMLSTIRAREERVAAAEAVAERDPLTGLRNRAGWQSAIETEEQRCRRYGGTASVLALDLDDLKLVNDTEGHATGDQLLVRCAEALAATARPGDAVARLGGDEFGVLAVECDSVSASALLVRVRVQLRAAGLSVSVAAATRRFGEGLDETWQRADTAMYRTKRRRKQTRADRLPAQAGPSPRSPRPSAKR